MTRVFSIFLGLGVSVIEAAVESPQLWVELVETTGLDEQAIAAMKMEVERIYRSAGVAILWLEEAPVQSMPHVGRVYVLENLPDSLRSRLRTFKGNGAPPMALGLGKERGVSGATLYVSRRAVMGAATQGAMAEPAPKVLALALGRVIAHELAHRFLQRNHTRQGVLKADFSAADLIGSGAWAVFTEEQAERLAAVAAKR